MLLVCGAKLDGRDPDPGYRMNVSEQVSGRLCACRHVTLLLLYLLQVKFIIICYRLSSLLFVTRSSSLLFVTGQVHY